MARRSLFPHPDEDKVLDEVISKEPLALAVAAGDRAWSNAVKWIILNLIQGEELGITSKNIATFTETKDPSIRRFWGIDAKLGTDRGIPKDFARRAIENVGNYGEIYDRDMAQPLGLARGLNNLWTKGGLLYSPPFR